MAQGTRDNLHSRLVSVLKVILPLLALTVLSSLFLFSRSIDPQDAIPYAKVDVEDRLRQPRMTDAAYSGTTPDGASLVFSAREVKPDAKAVTTSGLKGKLQTPDGVTTEIAAFQGRFDKLAKAVKLTGGVELQSSNGYIIQTDTLDIALDRTWLESGSKVSAQGTLGQITANSMRLSKHVSDDTYILVFTGDVRLLYQPIK